jgi:hypothetical protein
LSRVSTPLGPDEFGEFEEPLPPQAAASNAATVRTARIAKRLIVVALH